MAGNRAVLAILRSRAHWLLSGFAVEVRYRGRRSGREFAVPLQYAKVNGRLVVRPQKPDQSTWWRNFRAPRPVVVLISGRQQRGSAQLLEPGDPDWEYFHKAYVDRWRGAASRRPLVVISLLP